MGTVTFFVIEGKMGAFTRDSRIDAVYQFPIGVNPLTKEIVENPSVDTYFATYIAEAPGATTPETAWIPKVVGKLALIDWYQNLASLSTRILVIQSGERKEEVANNFGKILGWSEAEKAEFLLTIEEASPEFRDGKFFPGKYIVSRGAKPDLVSTLVITRFNTQVVGRYGRELEAIVPLNDALVVASILEREAYDFEDMRHISGVIWNRLFAGMKLQIDATLQYAKGSNPNQPWWPAVRPNDKYIASLYNTYEHEGLPPAPISNPSLEAILATLNPRKTECIFYFHTRNGDFYCSVTYEEHVAQLRQHYGQGR